MVCERTPERESEKCRIQDLSPFLHSLLIVIVIPPTKKDVEKGDLNTKSKT